VPLVDHLKNRARLEPDRIDRLLTGDWLTTGPFRLNQDLTADDLTASIAFVNCGRLSQTIKHDAGAPVGPHGRFTHEYRIALAQELWWGPTGDPPPADDELLDESLRPLELMQRALQVAGLLELSGTRLHVTDTAHELLSREHGGDLFAKLVRAYFADLDHSLIDHEPAIPTAWSYVPYAIYIVDQMNDRWYDIDVVLSNLIPADIVRAENQRLESIKRPDRVTPTVHWLFLMRFVDLLPDFGLLTTQPTVEGEPGFLYPRYQRGPLFERVVRFVW